MGLVRPIDPSQRLRRRDHRRRPGRPRRGGVRGIRGTLGARARLPRLRRPGGRVGAHRELHGLPDRHLRHGADGARLQPGAEVRGRDGDPRRGRPPGVSPEWRRARFQLDLANGEQVRRAPSSSRAAPVPPPRRRESRRVRGRDVHYWASPLEARLCAGQRSRWSAPATPRDRLSSFSRARRKGLVIVRGAEPRRDHVALPGRPHRVAPERRGVLTSEVTALEGSGGIWRPSELADARRAETARPLRHLFLFIGADPNTAWLRLRRRARREGLRPHRRRRRPRAGRSRPAARASSRSATCALARSSASPPPWAKARRSWQRSTPFSHGAERPLHADYDVDARGAASQVTPSARGCEECLKLRSQWVHLRLCRTCGHVGCCDSSPHRHATKHFHATGHPVIEGYDPPEGWAWCLWTSWCSISATNDAATRAHTAV